MEHCKQSKFILDFQNNYLDKIFEFIRLVYFSNKVLENYKIRIEDSEYTNTKEELEVFMSYGFRLEEETVETVVEKPKKTLKSKK